MAQRGSKGSGGSSRKKGVSFVKGEGTRKKRVASLPKRTASSRSASSSAKASTRKVVKPKTPKVKAAPEAPGWNDLVTDNKRKQSAQSEAESYLGAITTTRFAVAVLSVATLFTLYVGHVLTTQDLLSDVEVLRRENANLELRLNQFQGMEDELTSYAEIVDRARELGLKDRVPEGNPIIVQ